MKHSFIIIFLLLTLTLVAQRPFIEIHPEMNYQCSGSEMSYVNTILNDDRYEVVYPIQINPISDAINDHKLKIELPGQIAPIDLPLEFIDYTDDNNFAIDGGGRVGPGNPCLQSNFSLGISDRGNGIRGMISYGNDNYQILKVCNNQYFLLKDDVTKYKHCAHTSTGVSSAKPQNQNIQSRSTNSISILVLFTPEAWAESSINLYSKVDFDIDQMNTILRNSFKDNYSIDILDIIQLNNTQMTGVTGSASSRDTLRQSQEVIALRDLYGADLVYVYLPDQNFGSSADGGISSLFDYNTPNGFLSVGRINASPSTRVFAH